ncbi:hypothetical protein A9J41_15295 [Laribacter hongkongensis]|uniref:hypothetical protein n=2 Tax=Laribacter hongkongensis TaxID=168471 RepID=UPI001878AF5A|nr:hypothetical protein [Laribacter hongkongensis]MBE5529477.1 hypothetical protein [Laribacter hongkongensis]
MTIIASGQPVIRKDVMRDMLELLTGTQPTFKPTGRVVQGACHVEPHRVPSEPPDALTDSERQTIQSLHKQWMRETSKALRIPHHQIKEVLREML